MRDEEDLGCEIYVDTDVDEDDLFRLVCSLTGALKGELRTITTDWSEIDIKRNEVFDEIRRLEELDGFLYYRYYFDVEPGESISRDRMIESVGKFLEGLWGLGWKAVTACDYEDELPRRGGYRMTAP